MAILAPNPSFNGLSDVQVSQVFARIACTANLVAELCREHAATVGDTEQKNTFHALNALVSSLGAMADIGTPLGNTGDLAAWMLGPECHGLNGAQHAGDRPAPTRFNGLSDGQLSLLLRNIATSIDLLAETCSESAANAGRTTAALHFHVVGEMLSSVGALADMALCSPVKGSFAVWKAGVVFCPEVLA